MSVQSSSTLDAVSRSRRALTWERRRAAVRRFWRLFRQDRVGLIGLAVLIVMVIVALAAPLLANSRGLNVTLAHGPLDAGPSLSYPLGTDTDGRSVLTLLIWGSRISLLVGITATLISVGLGAVVGIVAGQFGGWVDNVLMRITDWFLVIPFLPLAIALAIALGRGIGIIIFVIGVTSWPGTARIVRAQALTVKTRPYLERSRALGAGHLHQMVKHLLPSVMPLLLANTILTVSDAILAESTLSFLGLGDPTRQSWGEMLNNVFESTGGSAGNVVWLIAPGTAIIIVVLAFTVVGHTVEGALSPRLRER
ncbi:MAG TPA: ABC transporter permease [Solirubrobacteraceae bacterium]|nr:ABC transporter permease [Solirubrobacteraceae bacterium]